MLGNPAALGGGVLVEHGAQLLGGMPRDEHLVVAFVGGDGAVEPGALPVGEPVLAAAQDVPDPVQRVTGAAAVPEGLLLDPAPDFVDRVAPELDDVEGVDDGDRVLPLVVDGVLVPVERVQGGDLDPPRKASPRLVSQSRYTDPTGQEPGPTGVPGCCPGRRGSDRPSRSAPWARA